MRLFPALTMLALVTAPGMACAQKVPPPPPMALPGQGDALAQMGVWTKRMAAAQQPVADAYQQCAPILQKVTGLLRSGDHLQGDASAKLMAETRACNANIRAAAAVSRDNLAGVGRMPAAMEQMLHIDSGEMLRQSGVSIDGMVRYLGQVEEMLDLSLKGDTAAARDKWHEAQKSAGAAIDGQIVMLEAMRAGMPTETNKALLDVRVTLSRASRAIIVEMGDQDQGELAKQLSGYATDMRSMAERVRANWRIERKTLAVIAKPGGTDRLSVLLAALDENFGAVAGIADGVADTLGKVEPGPVPPVIALQTIDKLAKSEIQILQQAKTLAAAMQ